MARVIAASTQKGGVLKTSLVTNMAGVLSKTKRVLIVDTDSQGNSIQVFGKNPRALELTLYDVLAGGVSPDLAILNVHENIDILPSNKDMSLLELNMIAHPEKFPKPFQLLKRALEPIKERYDYILLDTPANTGLIQANAVACVDEVIIPFQPEEHARLALVEMQEFIEQIKTLHNPSLSILGVIFTLVDFRTTLHQMIMEDCQKYCAENKLRMFKTSIPRAIHFASTVSFNQLPATLVNSKKHPVVNKYYNLIREVEEIDPKTNAGKLGRHA